MQEIISTKAPLAIGVYSQAIRHNDTIYLSGQIPLDPATMKLISQDIEDQIHQVFKNLLAVTQAAGGSLADLVKLNVYVTNLEHFSLVNETMLKYFTKPYPARAVVEVSKLPKDAKIEIDGIMIISHNIENQELLDTTCL